MNIEELDEGLMGDRPRHEVVKHLNDRGWIGAGGGGSHEKFTHPTAVKHISVPYHRKLDGGTLKAIIKQADEYRNQKPVKESRIWNIIKETIKEVTDKKKVKKQDQDKFIPNPNLTSDIMKEN